MGSWIWIKIVTPTKYETLAKNVAQACSKPTAGYECSAKSTPHVDPFLQESGVPGITPKNHGDFLIDTSSSYTKLGSEEYISVGRW